MKKYEYNRKCIPGKKCDTGILKGESRCRREDQIREYR